MNMSANNASFNHHYQSITALVVDDQLPMANILKGMLSSLGLAKVLVARNGKDALHILENRHVDIILSDWNMPKMNGLSLLKALRNEMSSSVPFIMVTANIRHKDVQQAIDAGVSESSINCVSLDSYSLYLSNHLVSPEKA